MTILYKVCFSINRDINECTSSRPFGGNISDIIKANLISLLRQMTDEDNIVFFLDGEDQENVIEFICTEFNVNYKIYNFNHKCAAKINNECILYILLILPSYGCSNTF